MDHETEYVKQIVKILRDHYRVSWTQAVKAFGRDNIHNHYKAGVMQSEVARRIAHAVNKNKPLSPKQQEVYDKLSETEWQSAYDLQCSKSTLDSLLNKGLVAVVHGLGASFSPRTSILYRKLKH